MNLLERLRAETRPAHEQMEATFRLPHTRDDLRRWTEVFLGFIEPFETRLTTTLGPDHPFLAGRSKATWLRNDLRALGAGDAEIAAVPRCHQLPAVETPARALGALYVFEGATLGGQLISRHLETHAGVSEGRGYSYFQSYGADVPRRWQEFRALLQINSAPAADDAIVAAAQDTFRRLQAWCETAYENH